MPLASSRYDGLARNLQWTTLTDSGCVRVSRKQRAAPSPYSRGPLREALLALGLRAASAANHGLDQELVFMAMAVPDIAQRILALARVSSLVLRTIAACDSVELDAEKETA